jgi:hypothetical protein
LLKAEKALKESNTLNKQLILKPETSCPAGSNLLEYAILCWARRTFVPVVIVLVVEILSS